MKKLVRNLALVWLTALLLFALAGAPGARAQADPAADMLNRINTARLAQGLAPYALNSALVTAAEQHSQDMAATGKVDHTGSDQSSYRERILAAGYGQWNFGPIVNESIYGGTGGADIAFDWWMGSDTQRGQILSVRYREVGIAAVTGANGWTYWTLTFGAQPNVLPAFINDGASKMDEVDVLITLTNENAVPAGEGTATMGQALQVRLAHDEQFTNANWQPWQVRLPFQLLPQAEQRVYVQYRDAQGRTAIGWTLVTLTNVPPTASPSPQPTDTPAPLATDTPTASPTTRPTDQPPTEVPPTSAVQPTASPRQPATSTAAPVSTPQPPTRTPRPRPSPRLMATPTAHLTSLNDGSPPPGLVPTLLVLQAVAILLGIALAARHPRS